MKRILLALSFSLSAVLSGETVFHTVLEKGFVPPGGVVPFAVTIVHPSTAVFVDLVTNTSHPDIEFGVNPPEVTDTGDGRRRTRITGILQVFTITNIMFDGFRIRMTGPDGTNARVLGRAGVTVVTPPVDFKKNPPLLPAKGPLPYKRNHALLLAGLALLLAVATGLFLYIRKKRAAAGAAIPVLSDAVDPWELVVSRLAYLRQHLPGTEQEIKDFYFELTETARMYLSGRTQLPFEESTTTELKALLPAVPWVDSEEAATLVDLFTDADMVKFARFHPDESTVETFFSAMENWLAGIDGEYHRHQAGGGGRHVQLP